MTLRCGWTSPIDGQSGPRSLGHFRRHALATSPKAVNGYIIRSHGVWVAAVERLAKAAPKSDDVSVIHHRRR